MSFQDLPDSQKRAFNSFADSKSFMEEDDNQSSDGPPPDIHDFFMACEYDNDSERQLLYDFWMDLRRRAHYPHVQTRATQMLKDDITGIAHHYSFGHLGPSPQSSPSGQLLKTV